MTVETAMAVAMAMAMAAMATVAAAAEARAAAVASWEAADWMEETAAIGAANEQAKSTLAWAELLAG
eukprot:3505489-Pleurochrysis_carterae.AAC.4